MRALGLRSAGTWLAGHPPAVRRGVAARPSFPAAEALRLGEAPGLMSRLCMTTCLRAQGAPVAPGAGRTLSHTAGAQQQQAPTQRRNRPGGAALPAARAALVRPKAASPATEPLASPMPGVPGVPGVPASDDDDEIGRALAAAAEQRARLAAALADESRWRLVIDCGFVHTLTAHKELRSLAKQIQTSVGHNRRAEAPFCLQVTSWFGEIAQYAEGTMGGAAWPLLKRQQPTLELFPREAITVLSPDAAEPLTDLDPARVYVVGGIVDKSVIRGVTAGFAARHELQVRRLPTVELAQQLALGPGAPKRPVLNIDDVVYALLRYRVNGGDWLDALDAAIPARKRGARPGRGSSSGGGGDGSASRSGSESESGGNSGSGSEEDVRAQ